MTELYCFAVDRNPIPKGRPRVVHGYTYTPPRTKAWEETVAWTYKQCGGPMFTGGLSVNLRFYRATGRRVDLDNLIKAVLDALNGVAWSDDFQIQHLEAWLFLKEEHPRVEVEIMEWTEEAE